MAISALLPLASVTLAVTVVTPGKYASIGTGIGGAIGCGQSKRIKGFPPVAEYKLARGRPDVREKEPRTLIAEGIEPISIIRREHTAATYLVHNLRRQINADHPDYALRCLQKLAGIPADEHQLRSVVERNCEWTTPQALLDDLNDFEEDLRGQYQSVLTKLADKSLLPRKHADEVQLPIEFRLVDLRDLSDKKEPLPKVKNR